MNLRKNVPVVPGKNETPPPVKGAKKAFLQIIGGLVAVMFMIFHFLGTGTSKTPRNTQPQQQVAEANQSVNQSANQSQQRTPDVDAPKKEKLQQKPAAEPKPAEASKPQPKPAEVAPKPQPKPVEQPKPAPQPKPVAQAKPTVPRPSNVNVGSSSGKVIGWLKTAGKIGLGIITKGKVRIR